MTSMNILSTEEQKYCSDCPLLESPYVMGYGHSKCPVMVVGTAPGKAEEEIGYAFMGPLGLMTREILESMGLKEEDTYFTNVVKRRPRSASGDNREPSKRECYKCGMHLMHEVVRAEPKFILTLGATPLKFFVGSTTPPLSIMHGLTISPMKFVFDFQLIPTYELSYIQRKGGLNSPMGEEWLQDLQEFVWLVKRELDESD